MEVGPCGYVSGQPSGLQHGGGPEPCGPLPFLFYVPGDIAGAGNLIAARQGVYAGAEVRSGLRVKAGTETQAHAGLQGDGLAGFDDVGAGGLQADALLEAVSPLGGAGDDATPVPGEIFVAVPGRVGDVGLAVGSSGAVRAAAAAA